MMQFSKRTSVIACEFGRESLKALGLLFLGVISAFLLQFYLVNHLPEDASDLYYGVYDRPGEVDHLEWTEYFLNRKSRPLCPLDQHDWTDEDEARWYLDACDSKELEEGMPCCGFLQGRTILKLHAVVLFDLLLIVSCFLISCFSVISALYYCFGLMTCRTCRRVARSRSMGAQKWEEVESGETTRDGT